ncbi:hypothetical protein LVJ94_45960 [Pendulispora rubella]|uniref:Uncharacterized protein n=1 Tax=Pendulispora rubella TaxID=2741070 RepID=A0ABZ2KZZ2_9BACT
MSESREYAQRTHEKSESLNGARVRFLLLGLIIGASAIVAFTNDDPSFGTAHVVQQAMPSASTLPGAIASAILPRLPESARIPEVDVNTLPKAAPEPSAAAGKRAAGAKGKKKGEAEDGKKAATAPTAGGEGDMALPPGFQQVLEGMQGFGGAFKSED